MTIQELINRKAVYKTNDFNRLVGCYYSHIPEATNKINGFFDYSMIKEDNDIKLVYYKNHCFDHRRVWQLYSVWYKDFLVMICQNAGREGDDFDYRFIVNEDKYFEMIAYLVECPLTKGRLERKFIFESEFDRPTGRVETDINKEIEDLDNFYGYKLDGHFDKW